MESMATVYSCSGTNFLQSSIGSTSRRICFKHSKPTYKHLSLPKIRASVTTVVEARPDLISNEKAVNIRKSVLACPICYSLLTQNDDLALVKESKIGTNFHCNICKKSYSSNEIYLDLTVGSGAKEYTESNPASSEIFRTSLVSFLYERGWRQNFIWGGFPGPEKEFELAKDYLKPVLGGNIVDASCGSGLFSRRFAKSGIFSHVIALDFSENMLRQCHAFVKEEGGFNKENLLLVRADVSRLPFVSNSIDALHAGAALHCWPSPSSAVAEISRVLRPGGVFVATTFILDGFFSALPFLRVIKQYFGQTTSNQIFLSEKELEDLCKACGLVGFSCVRNGTFIMLSATKPG